MRTTDMADKRNFHTFNNSFLHYYLLKKPCFLQVFFIIMYTKQMRYKPSF
jgi:hypothetical protein